VSGVTWRDRARRLIAAKLREMVDAGATLDAESLSPRGAVPGQIRMAWLASSMYAGASYPAKVFAAELRIALERLRQFDPEAVGPCTACGAPAMQPCVNMGGELAEGQRYHAARRPLSKLEQQVADIVASRRSP